MATYLIDGTFELFRCFHGAPRATAGGREVGAVRAFAHTLISLLRTEDLTHVALAFDPMSGTVRLPGDAGPNSLIRAQYPLSLAVCRALGIRVWPMIRYQADDALATGARRIEGRVVLCTTDNDLAQCVEGTRVVLLDRIRKRITDEDGVVAKFGVPPRCVPDWLALVGDRSDGLPGLPGCGAKSAAALLNAFGTVDAIPLDLDAWPSIRGKATLFMTFQERREEIRLHAALSRKHHDLPIPLEPALLRWPGANRPAFDAVVRDLEAPDLLERTLRFAEARV